MSFNIAATKMIIFAKLGEIEAYRHFDFSGVKFG